MILNKDNLAPKPVEPMRNPAEDVLIQIANRVNAKMAVIKNHVHVVDGRVSILECIDYLLSLVPEEAPNTNFPPLQETLNALKDMLPKDDLCPK